MVVARRLLVLVLVIAPGCGRLGYHASGDGGPAGRDAGADRDTGSGLDGSRTDACPGCVPLGAACEVDAACQSGHCADGMCCDAACTGDCNACVAGACTAVPAACSGECATCAAAPDGYRCSPVESVCLERCSSAVCVGSGTVFSCDVSSCCSTGSAPNFTGRCGAGVDALVGSGCSFEWDFNDCCNVIMYREVEWDVQECLDGAWVATDSGADAYSCRSCALSVTETWSDTCGNRSGNRVVCP